MKGVSISPTCRLSGFFSRKGFSEMKFSSHFPLTAVVFAAVLLSAFTLMAPRVFAEETPEAPPRLTPVQRGIHAMTLTDCGGGEWEIRTTGTDPYFYIEMEGDVDLGRTPIFAFESFSVTGVGRLLIFVGEAVDVPHMVEYHAVARTEGWTAHGVDISATQAPPARPVKQLRVTMGQHPGNTARIRNLTLRAPLPHELAEKENRVRNAQEDDTLTRRLDAYLKYDFPLEIFAILDANDRISISGTMVGPHWERELKNLYLVEVPMWKDVTQFTGDETRHPLPMTGTTKNGESVFRITLPRTAEDKSDRLLTGFALARVPEESKDATKWELLSPLCYPAVTLHRANLPKMVPRSKKGLGGCPLDHPDMQTLAVASVTFNIILSHLIFADDAPGRVPCEYAGRTWYVDLNNLKNTDRNAKIASENGWMVTAIILIPPGRHAPEGSWHRTVSHPDADHGCAFVMPNFTTREGVEAYAAIMNFLAERYSRPDGEHGRIHHWVMHNEINSGFYWTSAGRKSTVTYMNLYQKSMRLTQNFVRQYDSHGKTFISLDHCWTAVHDPRAYAGRTQLEYLAKFSRKEGDFEWGIAFHPYPQDISNPRAWEDPDARPDEDTPYVAYKNLEVLDTWAIKPEVAFYGNSREIQLTEQGLNSPDYSEKSLREQAAGMAYAWQKVKPLAAVTAFQYHLWADAHEEGGLRLGLRKYADDPDDPLGKKPIWETFRVLDTPEEAGAYDEMREIMEKGQH